MSVESTNRRRDGPVVPHVRTKNAGVSLNVQGLKWSGSAGIRAFAGRNDCGQKRLRAETTGELSGADAYNRRGQTGNDVAIHLPGRRLNS